MSKCGNLLVDENMSYALVVKDDASVLWYNVILVIKVHSISKSGLGVKNIELACSQRSQWHL